MGQIIDGCKQRELMSSKNKVWSTTLLLDIKMSCFDVKDSGQKGEYSKQNHFLTSNKKFLNTEHTSNINLMLQTQTQHT